MVLRWRVSPNAPQPAAPTATAAPHASARERWEQGTLRKALEKALATAFCGTVTVVGREPNLMTSTHPS